MQAASRATGRPHIAIPAYCCYDVITAVNGAAAGVVLYDIDPLSLNPVWESLEAALATRPAAVLVAHLFGLAVDMPRVQDLAESVDSVVIEDTAQGIGASLLGRPLGTFGQLRVLSFGRGKGVTGGRGGALLVAPASRGLLEQGAGSGDSGLRELSALAAQWLLARPSLFRIPANLPGLRLGDTIYRTPSPPRPISQVAAAVVLEMWKQHRTEVEVRRQNAERLGKTLAKVGVAEQVRPVTDSDPSWLRLPVLLPAIQRTDASVTAARAFGVMPGYPRPLDSLEQTPASAGTAPLPGAARLAAELWTLPTHSLLTEHDLGRLENWLAGLEDRRTGGG
jgi:dTDP-4-amino-4,6-dideoxygalactose transaminase